jgi:hypothetical protein
MTKSDRERPSPPGSKVQTMESNEKIVRANGVDLYVATFGDRADPRSALWPMPSIRRGIYFLSESQPRIGEE